MTTQPGSRLHRQGLKVENFQWCTKDKHKTLPECTRTRVSLRTKEAKRSSAKKNDCKKPREVSGVWTWEKNVPGPKALPQKRLFLFKKPRRDAEVLKRKIKREKLKSAPCSWRLCRTNHVGGQWWSSQSQEKVVKEPKGRTFTFSLIPPSIADVDTRSSEVISGMLTWSFLDRLCSPSANKPVIFLLFLCSSIWSCLVGHRRTANGQVQLTSKAHMEKEPANYSHCESQQSCQFNNDHVPSSSLLWKKKPVCSSRLKKSSRRKKLLPWLAVGEKKGRRWRPSQQWSRSFTHQQHELVVRPV